MLTSLGRDLDPGEEAVACFAGRLTKPVRSSQLYDAIMAAIAGREASVDEPIAKASTVTSGGARSTPARLEILLAEDMELNRTFALLALEELGYQASVVVNGAEVLRALNRISYDVILMDVQMPEMDGLETTRRIRRDVPADRQPYIIAMTANAMRGDREVCLEAGMDAYLSKPARGDVDGVRDAAHGLKGTSGYVGAARVVNASAQIERAARAGDAIDMSAVEMLREELTAVRRELLTMFRESPFPMPTRVNGNISGGL